MKNELTSKEEAIIGKELKLLLNKIWEMLSEDDQTKIIEEKISDQKNWSLRDWWDGFTNTEKQEIVLDLLKDKLSKND